MQKKKRGPHRLIEKACCISFNKYNAKIHIVQNTYCSVILKKTVKWKTPINL